MGDYMRTSLYATKTGGHRKKYRKPSVVTFIVRIQKP